MSPFAYLKVKALTVLKKASNAFWWIALATLAAGIAGRLLWEILVFGWKIPAWVFHWSKSL